MKEAAALGVFPRQVEKRGEIDDHAHGGSLNGVSWDTVIDELLFDAIRFDGCWLSLDGPGARAKAEEITDYIDGWTCQPGAVMA